MNCKDCPDFVCFLRLNKDKHRCPINCEDCDVKERLYLFCENYTFCKKMNLNEHIAE